MFRFAYICILYMCICISIRYMSCFLLFYWMMNLVTTQLYIMMLIFGKYVFVFYLISCCRSFPFRARCFPPMKMAIAGRYVAMQMFHHKTKILGFRRVMVTPGFKSFLQMSVPQNGWFTMENPIKMDDLGVFPLFFLETPKYVQRLERTFLSYGVFWILILVARSDTFDVIIVALCLLSWGWLYFQACSFRCPIDLWAVNICNTSCKKLGLQRENRHDSACGTQGAS